MTGEIMLQNYSTYGVDSIKGDVNNRRYNYIFTHVSSEKRQDFVDRAEMTYLEYEEGIILRKDAVKKLNNILKEWESCDKLEKENPNDHRTLEEKERDLRRYFSGIYTLLEEINSNEYKFYGTVGPKNRKQKRKGLFY